MKKAKIRTEHDFDGALKIIPELKSEYKLGIVSDAWPS